MNAMPLLAHSGEFGPASAAMAILLCAMLIHFGATNAPRIWSIQTLLIDTALSILPVGLGIGGLITIAVWSLKTWAQ